MLSSKNLIGVAMWVSSWMMLVPLRRVFMLTRASIPLRPFPATSLMPDMPTWRIPQSQESDLGVPPVLYRVKLNIPKKVLRVTHT